jgi:hypothetical protein
MSKSTKHNFLERIDEDQDLSDNVIEVDRTQYNPGPKHREVHLSPSRIKVLRGGLGSGKTRTASEHVNAILQAYPGARAVIARKNLGDLKDTTQREFLNTVVAPETIAGFNVNDNDLHYKNSSIAMFRETKDPLKFKSFEIAIYLLDECDENPTDAIFDMLDQRLRQQPVMIDGVKTPLPFQGLLVTNPPDEEHWIAQLAGRTDLDVRDFQFTTFDNQHNLPPDYIPNLMKRLPPWEIDRLIYGNWGRDIKGKPVIHGFAMETHVRTLKFRPDLPLLRGWDFGFNHPCVSFGQMDPHSGRFYKHREYLGNKQYLPDVVRAVKEITVQLAGIGHPVEDFADPHGLDQKDTGPGSIEVLRVEHGIHCLSHRTRIKTGLEEIQRMVLGKSLVGDGEHSKLVSHFLVDPSCRMTIAAYMGGYHRDESGEAVKDGKYDHLVDTDRYVIVNKKNSILSNWLKMQGSRKPRNPITGY